MTRSLRHLAMLPRRWKDRLAGLSLADQFLLFSLLVLVAGALVIGRVVAMSVERAVINRTMAMSALYVDSFIGEHLMELGHSRTLSPEHVERLEALMAQTPLGKEVVSFKVWLPDGEIVYATDKRLIGRRFEIGPGLRSALAGHVYSHISDLDDPEQHYERLRWNRLVETYAPVREHATGRVIAAAEFYQPPYALEREIEQAQRRAWTVVGTATLLMFLALNGTVRRASNLIVRQNQELQDLVHRLHQVAEQKTQTDERLLQRIARDLHDGPAQDVSLALLRIETLFQASPAQDAAARERDFQMIQTALQNALREIRQISTGLLLPELENLTLEQVARRACENHQAVTDSRVRLTVGPLPRTSTMPVKITVYRVIQEALRNAYRHGGAREAGVRVEATQGTLCVTVHDEGTGFQPDSLQPAVRGVHLGLRGMRERVELLGGRLLVDSTPGHGTTLRAYLPLGRQEEGEAGGPDSDPGGR